MLSNKSVNPSSGELKHRTRSSLAQNRLHILRRKRLLKHDAIINDLDRQSLIASREGNSCFDALIDRADEVVQRTSRGRHVQRGFAAGVAAVQDFERVQLAAAGRPARAGGIGAVLRRERDLRVHEPDGGHVAVEVGVAGQRHREGEEEDLLIPTETV